MFPISTLSHQLWNYCFDFMCFMDLSETKQPSHSSCSWIAYNIRPCLCPLYISALHALASLDRIKVACSAASYRRFASSNDVCSTIHVTHLQMHLFLPYVNSYHWKRAFSTHVMVWCQGMKNDESWSVPNSKVIPRYPKYVIMDSNLKNYEYRNWIHNSQIHFLQSLFCTCVEIRVWSQISIHH